MKNNNNQKQIIKEIKKALPKVDILESIGVDIETADDNILRAVSGELQKYMDGIQTVLDKVSFKIKENAINNQAHDEFVIGLGLDCSVETYFERKESFKINVKALQDAAGITYHIDSVKDPELAKLTPVGQGYRRKDTIDRYKKGDPKVIPFVTDHSHDQVVLNIKLGGQEEHE